MTAEVVAVLFPGMISLHPSIVQGQRQQGDTYFIHLLLDMLRFTETKELVMGQRVPLRLSSFHSSWPQLVGQSQAPDFHDHRLHIK